MATKAEDKKSFIMYVDYQSDFEEMTGDECKTLMMYIFNYERTHEEPVIEDRFMRMAWGRIKRDLDRNDSAWLETKEKLSEAGKKGAEKRWHSDNSHPITSDSHPITPIASIAVNVNDNLNVNDNVLEASVLNEPRFSAEAERDKQLEKVLQELEEKYVEEKKYLSMDEAAELAWK